LRLLSRPPSLAAARFRREGAGILGLEIVGHEGGVLSKAIAGALDLHDLGVVQQAIEQGCSDDLVAEDVAPFAEAAV
jgi:hypothetical protein